MAESIVDFHIRSIMCAPLVGSDGEALGVLQIDTQDPRNRFSRDDLDVLASVACQAAFAVENAQLHESVLREQAMERDLSLAHQVQRGFLPTAAPRLPDYDFFEFYEPANKLGGDYFDYVPLPGGRLGVVVADVSGKGIAASLLMARLSADTRYCLASEATPAAAVARLNRVFCDGRLGRPLRDLRAGGARSRPARNDGGQRRPPAAACSRRARGQDRRRWPRPTPQLPLGVDQRTSSTSSTRSRWTPGNMLALYTDGITEAMNDEDLLYGDERLRTQLACRRDADRPHRPADSRTT